jgi:16S rRNA processing protein RimM
LNTPSTSNWVPLATLLRPQGRKGELLSEPLSDLPDIFATGTEVFLAAKGADAPSAHTSPRVLEGHFFPTGKNAGRIVLKLTGCDSISEAEAIAGQQILVASTHLPELDADTFFVGDLVGCTLFDGPTSLGTVTDVEFATGPDGRTRLEDAAPLLAVQLTAQETEEPVLVPFIRAWLETIDISGRRIVMHLPEGLLDTE